MCVCVCVCVCVRVCVCLSRGCRVLLIAAETDKKVQPDTMYTGLYDIRNLRQYVKFNGQTSIEVHMPARTHTFTNTHPHTNTHTNTHTHTHTHTHTNAQVCPSQPCPDNPLVRPWATYDACVVQGSDGGAFPMPVRATDRPRLFVTSFYRSLDLTYVGPVEHLGIRLLRFTLPPEMWLNKSEHPPNSVYYQDVYTGVLNMTITSQYVPIFVSRPRYRGVDTRIASQVNITYAADPSVRCSVSLLRFLFLSVVVLFVIVLCCC